MAIAYLFALFLGALVLKRAAEGPQAKFSRLAGLLLGAGLTLTYAFEGVVMRHLGFYAVCAGLLVLGVTMALECFWNFQQTMQLLRSRRAH